MQAFTGGSEGGFDQHGKSHTKQLVAFGISAVIIILAAAILLQYMEQGPAQQGFAGFSEEYCLSLLQKHYPEVSDAVFSSSYPGQPYITKETSFLGSPLTVSVFGTQDGRVTGCHASAATGMPSDETFSNEKNCGYSTIRYKHSRNSRYLFAFQETEFPERIEENGVTVIDYRESGIPRFIRVITYMNPDEQDNFNLLIASMNMEC